MFKNQLHMKLAFFITAGLILSPFAEAAFRTSKTGKGKFDGTSVSTITSTCTNNGFPSDTAGANLCQEVTAGTYDTDCVNWGLDQSPVVSISACSGLTHTQYSNFKTSLGQATLGISNGGNGFTSYTEQKSYFDTYLTNTKAIYANQLGYSASSDHNTTFEAAASAVANLQTQCSSSDTSPLTTCSSSISNCACIPKSEYENIASGAVAIAAALDAADNTPHTLTKALIDDIVDLDTSSIDLTDSNVIDYLAVQFSTLDSLTTTQPSQLTSYVVGATATNVALWKIGKMVSDSTNHPSSSLNEALIDNAIGNSFSTSDTLALDSTKTISTLRTALSSSGLGSSPTASSVQNWVGTHVGFASAASFTAYLANSDSSNFTLSNWSSCYSSTQSTTGGAGSCSASSSGWDAIQAAITAASDPSTPISSSNISALLTSAGTTAHTYFDASNSVMTDYVNNCISGVSDAAAAVSSCVSSGTNADFKKKVNAFRVAKVVASNSGSYTTSTLTSQILIDAGVTSSNQTYMDASYCGTAGTSSCLAKLRTKLAASNLTTASTQAQVIAKINDLMEDVFEDSADSASIPAPSTNPSVGCSTSTNLTLPWICSYSAYTCSKQAGPSEWSMNDSNNLLVIPANYTGTGTKSVTIRATLNYSGSGYYKDYQRSYNIGQAVAASTQGYKWFTQGSTENPHHVKNQCSGKGGVWMTYDEVTSSPLSHQSKTFYSTGSAPCNSHGCWYGNSNSNIGFKQGSTIGVQKWQGSWWVGGSGQNATTTHYACKNLPVCN